VAATRAKTWTLLCKIAPSKNSDVVRFLWAEGVKPVEIHRRMLAQYGQSTMSRGKVYEWVERFKSGRTCVTDEGRFVGHQHRAAEKLLLRRNTETS